MNLIKIRDRIIGDGYPAYIIAEMSTNHSGSLERALEIVREAKRCGADCVKIQTYTQDTLTIDCHNKYFKINNGMWKGENLYDLYGKAYTPWEWQSRLKAEADRVGIDFFSTPSDISAVDFLEELGVDLYKIASFEMVDIPLLRYVASKGKPVIVSTGMGTLEEMKEAVAAMKNNGCNQIALLKCCSAYPAISEDMNLLTIRDMKKRFEFPVGLSDHSMGYLGAVTAVALGANIIEKHFCLGRESENPDASFSMTPQEFKEMTDAIRQVEKAMGKVSYGISKQEESSRVFRRSIFVVNDIEKGECFSKDNIRVIRSGYGEKPKYYEDILGMKAEQSIKRGTPFRFNQVEQGGILFLTNNQDSLRLFRWIKEQGETAYTFANKLDARLVRELAPKLIISYNYKYIIPREVLDLLPGKILNLHISYLPYNRGSSPNFFSIIENTKKGVTIHQVAEGLDTGDILWQKEVIFDEEKESFASTYELLQQTIMELFKEKWQEIKAGRMQPIPQKGEGTSHVSKQLEEFRAEHPFLWEDNIAQVKKKYGL